VSGGGAERGPGRGTSPWEWAAAAAGLLLVLGAIGFLLRQAVVRPATPPAIVLSVDSVHPAPGGFHVGFRARNVGGTTAADLHVEGELREGERTVETSEATLRFVPPGAERRGGLFFREDPRRHTLDLRALGYEYP
jgi:uncharacterized protein (TIGR02588 family)